MITILLKDIEFKRANENWEFESIYKLNYKTFVEEIPQHQHNQNGRLIDKFDNQNTYIIAIKNKKIIAMLALRDTRPFSLDGKMESLDNYLPNYKKICEVRLLSVKKEFRNTKIIYGMLKETFQYVLLKKYDVLVISGILNQQKLYRHIGFIPFGDITGSNDVQFQPMYITKESFKLRTFLEEKMPLSLLPGPVEISEEVMSAFSSHPLSHRSNTFKEIFDDTQRRLCSLVKSKNMEFFSGAGTLANDVICLEIAKLNRKGLILSNGEFGNRLIEHGTYSALDFISYYVPWGKAFDWQSIYEIIETEAIEWIFMVYSETSTGQVNDFQNLLPIAREKDIKVCIDAISAIGNMKVDLSDIYLASGVSGKGLASLCGLSMVFYHHTIKEPINSIPRCLDLYQYIHSQGVPFTLSSNLIVALHTALKNLNIDDKIKNINELHDFIKEQLMAVGILSLKIEGCTNPAVLTIPIEEQYDSRKWGIYLRSKGYLVSFESDYLLNKNWIQICLMGNVQKEQLIDLPKIFKYAMNEIL